MSVRRHVIANYAASGWAAIVGLAAVPLYVHYLGIESWGLVGFYATLQAWLYVFDLGLSPSVNRELARHSAGAGAAGPLRDLLKSVELAYALIACGLGLGVALLAPAIATSWVNPESLAPGVVRQAVMLMGLAIASQWMVSLYRGAIQGLQRQVWLSMATAGVATARAVGAAAVLAFGSPTIGAFLAFQCAAGLIESLLLGWYLHRHLPTSTTAARFSADGLRRVWGFTAGIAAVLFLSTGLMQIDKLLLARLLPLQEFGYFTLTVTVAGTLSLLVVPIYNVAFPRLSELVAAKDHGRLADQYHLFAQLVAMGVLPVAAILCFFAEPVVWLWIGDAEIARAVAPPLATWVIGTALNGLMHVPYAAQLAHGWTRLSVGLNAAALLFMIPAVFVLVPIYGAVAAGWIWIAVNAGFILFGAALMHGRILRDEKRSWYVHDVLAPLAAAVVVGFGLVALKPDEAPTRAGEGAFLIAAGALLGISVAMATPLGRRLVASCAGQLVSRAR